MKLVSTPFDGLFLIQRNRFTDDRGYFSELFKSSLFEKLGLPDYFPQDNYSFSTHHVLRGLHYQIPPYAQAKFVSVLAGEVLDVVVDLRSNSKTFGKWYSVVLSELNLLSMFVPEGFAHGFLVRSEQCIFHYKCSSEYAKDAERGLKWNDKKLDIDWGISNPIVSEKDAVLPKFNIDQLIGIFQ